jgi:epoxyqueuosine reductase
MSNTDSTKLTSLIKAKAMELGFHLCGIARPKRLATNQDVLQKWCAEGMNDKMNYLTRNTEKRADPSLLFKGAKSLVVAGISYFSENRQLKPMVPVLSRYAYGRSYQTVIVKKLDILLEFIKQHNPEAEGRAFSDTAPLFEKPWAAEAGLGWQGKHSVVINREIGSFFFLGVLILNLDLVYDEPNKKDYCGTCTLCIENCPTGAINNNRTIDARKCIANLTIEGRDPISKDLVPKLGRRVYGCDRCQEVCPWNKKPEQGAPEFRISKELEEMSLEKWKSLTETDFNRIFGDSPVERVGYERFKQNIDLVTGQKVS